MKRLPDPHYRHRFPAEIVSHAVWLYHAFCLSCRDVELMLAERGVVVSYETIRRWCRKFAEAFASRLRRRRPRPGDRWHLDEVLIRIRGVQYYLWRAVDRDGVVLDVLVQSRRIIRQPSRRSSRTLNTGKSRYLTNSTENSHQPTRQRERRMKRIKSPRQAQQFLSARGPIHQHSHPSRHLMSAAEYRVCRTNAFDVWKQEMCVRTVS
ncbi:hypothetical protein N825_29145 [Skermanella stibiiresistens SB22]|uniref:DDE domain-containing protein n=1 Tax=Skermanella stibiiresistens SB22 TaxID=1385369 RepID=W9GUD7_9PROT|nr:IS6 family transposase [Skermanella stibiiresistens]EWY36266.1 hypothetical protein N825_29145 [Skermanella stibiiresistens SB22]